MGRKTSRIHFVRSAAMLVVLSLGLSGCKTCQSIKNKLPFLGRKPEIVRIEPPFVSDVAPPPHVPGPVPDPDTRVVDVPRGDRIPDRPTAPPKLEEALQTVYFDFDSAVLREDARRALSGNVEWLKTHADVRVQIEGHCDERGTEEYNLHLGQRRADSVKGYLVSQAIEAGRLFTISYGEERPVDPGRGESAWSKNRRAQFSRY